MIPTLIEKDIKEGKARFKTYQTGVGGQSIIPVPANSYIVIFGFTYNPAGGGFVGTTDGSGATNQIENPLRSFLTQQVSFLSSSGFFPFIYHTELISRFLNNTSNRAMINARPIDQQVYIISNNDVSITVGLIDELDINTQQTIPVTNKTPFALTYGGSAAVCTLETAFSPNLATPVNFVQPSVKEFADYGAGVVTNANDQAFAIPDAAAGLKEPTEFIQNQVVAVRNDAAAHYFLNVQYALYTRDTPEQLG
jgi:hypothetical protein